MEDNNNDDTRQGLYDEFESEIVKAHNPEAYFDEDDLIEIFDYASDMDNYIVKMEVLLYGARHYPDSQLLATRRAWFYSSLGEMEAAAEVNSRVTNGGFLNKLLALRAENLADTTQLGRRLAEIVDESEELLDEDLIQLVDYCAESSMLDWVGANRKRVEAKSSYTPTFIYEYADRAEEAGDLATAQALFEELTMMEPFTVDFWMRLAKVQADNQLFTDALSSVEYALAVDNSYCDALRLKGKLLCRLDHDMNEVSAIFRKVTESPSAQPGDYVAYAATINALGRAEEAVAILKEVLEKVPMLQSAVDLLMVIDFNIAVPYIHNIVSTLRLEADTIITWVRELLSNDAVIEAVKLASLFTDSFRSSTELAFLIQLLYITGHYKEIISIIDSRYPEGISEIGKPEPAIVYSYLMSLVHRGKRSKALSEAKAHLSVIEQAMDEDLLHRADYILSETTLPAYISCVHAGYRHQLRDIINALSAPGRMPPSSFDPMLL